MLEEGRHNVRVQGQYLSGKGMQYVRRPVARGVPLQASCYMHLNVGAWGVRNLRQTYTDLRLRTCVGMCSMVP